MEYRIDFDPGGLICLAWSGKRLGILLGGGAKRRQSIGIEAAVLSVLLSPGSAINPA